MSRSVYRRKGRKLQHLSGAIFVLAIFSKEVPLLLNKNLGQFPDLGQLNLGNVPGTTGKTKLGPFPVIAGKSTFYSRELRRANISLL